LSRGVKIGLTLMDEHRLMVLWKRKLRRMFTPNKEAVTGGRRKLRNEELTRFVLIGKYHSSNEVKYVMGWACGTHNKILMHMRNLD